MNGSTSILAQLSRGNDYVQLDLREDSIRTAVADLYGGEQVLRASFPATAKAFDRGAFTAPLEVGRRTDFEDGAVVRVEQLYEKWQLLTGDVVVSLTNRASVIDSFVLLMSESGELIRGSSARALDVQHLMISGLVGLPDGFESQSLRFMCVVNYVTADGVLRALLSSSMTESVAYRVASRVQSVVVHAPVKKMPSKPLPINICYNRTPVAEEDVDYAYPESFNPYTQAQRLWAPLAADVVLKEAASDPFFRIDIASFTLKMDSGKGFASYQLEGREEEVEGAFRPTETGFSFQLDEEWRADVPSSRLPARDRIDLYFALSFQSKSGRMDSIAISSREEGASGGRVSVGWLNLLWGCVAEGTRVLMADGSEVCVELLQEGDLVRDSRGVASVCNIVKGEEASLIVIRCEGGQELRLSAGHPVLVVDGDVRRMVAAEEVRGDMVLMDAVGAPQGVVGIWKDYRGGVVYNLATDRAGTDEFIAEGLVIGGLSDQGGLAKEREELAAGVGDNPFESELGAWTALVGGEVLEG